jgi:hypothetical protein
MQNPRATNVRQSLLLFDKDVREGIHTNPQVPLEHGRIGIEVRWPPSVAVFADHGESVVVVATYRDDAAVVMRAMRAGAKVGRHIESLPRGGRRAWAGCG